MLKVFPKVLILLLSVLIIYSCNITKKLGSDEYLLDDIEYEFKDKKVLDGDLDNYVKQKPYSRFLGIPFSAWAYNQNSLKMDTIFNEYYQVPKRQRTQNLLDSLYIAYGVEDQVGKSNWTDRLFYRWGSKPTVLDTATAYASEENLEAYYFENGYFDAQVDTRFDVDSADRKAKIIYDIEVFEPSYLVEYSQAIQDSNMERIYEEHKNRDEVEVGSRFDVKMFERERDRLTNIYRNRGYFKFNEFGQDVIFKVDTTQSKELSATLKIAKPKSDSIKNYQQYYYNEVEIYADTAIEDSINHITEHKGYIIKSKDPLKLKPRVYTDAVVIKEGNLYQNKEVNDTRSLIFKRENFNLAGISIERNPDAPEDSLLQTQIFIKPRKKYDLELSFEGYYSQFLNLGISPGIRLFTRNVFGGGENLSFNVRGTLGTVDIDPNKTEVFNAYELSFETRLTFPRLLLPFNTEGLVPKRWNPNSSISLGLSGQRNIGLGSNNYNLNLDYDISPGIMRHQLEVINFEYIKNTQKDKYYRIFTVARESRNNSFASYFAYAPDVEDLYNNGEITEQQVEDLIYTDENFGLTLPTENYNEKDYTDFRNMIFRKRSLTQDVFIQSLTYGFTYDENLRPAKYNHPMSIFSKVEWGGPLLSAANAISSFKQKDLYLGNSAASIGGVPYSEFIKVDLDVRKTFNLNKKSSIASRIFIGVAKPYGNVNFLPFSRSYFGGGSNDVRGWQAYALSPSPLRPNDGGTYVDDMKLTFNIEYRQKLTGLLNGALFVDAGNIWSLDKDRPNTLFEFDKFYKQLGISPGIGFRFDFTFLIVRLDFAYKAYDPAYEIGDRWFKNVEVLKPTIQFGINYPF